MISPAVLQVRSAGATFSPPDARAGLRAEIGQLASSSFWRTARRSSSSRRRVETTWSFARAQRLEGRDVGVSRCHRPSRVRPGGSLLTVNESAHCYVVCGRPKLSHKPATEVGRPVDRVQATSKRTAPAQWAVSAVTEVAALNHLGQVVEVAGADFPLMPGGGISQRSQRTRPLRRIGSRAACA